ncbi:hypothetical protein [Comamonas thiooxydans]|uniref:hypothetical protein n=1 Tax=Comamonas thiooxydans TaxID=363952 RepID=UPI000B41D24C|nr:hypothetical protein [Comamonas thiooxydans]
MRKKSNWDSAYSEILNWAAHTKIEVATFTMSNHWIAPRRFEVRLCVRDAAGVVLIASHGERSARYLRPEFEFFILDRLMGALKLSPNQCRVLGEPQEGGPTYPLLPGDDPTWHTEQHMPPAFPTGQS